MGTRLLFVVSFLTSPLYSWTLHVLYGRLGHSPTRGRFTHTDFCFPVPTLPPFCSVTYTFLGIRLCVSALLGLRVPWCFPFLFGVSQQVTGRTVEDVSRGKVFGTPRSRLVPSAPTPDVSNFSRVPRQQVITDGWDPGGTTRWDA